MKTLRIVIILVTLFFFGCTKTVIVTQQQTTFNQYKAVKHDKITNKTKKPRKRKGN
ncbi:MAG: hypothetical protein NXI20_14260 [bacterium]|nr:hypothetical protein [bacterium]